ncbi:hypothetical protein KMM349_01650 [Stenotrophomonas maltophilia]|nr:hypothetical protein KMM349_01650 [Stenotrophomonas maltophilia]
MEYRIDAGHCMQHRLRIGQIAADLAHAHGLQFRVVAAVERQHLVTTFDQTAAQRLAKETTTTGDQDLHARFSSSALAQTASFSRPILAL